MSAISQIKPAIHRLGMAYVRASCAREYAGQTFSNVNERPIEFAFVFRQLAAHWPKRVLDVGTGLTALPHLMRNCGFLVTAIDNIRDYWPKGMVNRHYHVIDDDITQTRLSESFDLITCVSVLEHIREHRKALQSLYRLLSPGGKLVLTCPYADAKYVENVYSLPESSVKEKFPFITQAFSRKELDQWTGESGFQLIEQEYWQFFSGDYWTCGERITPPRQVSVSDRHQLTCLLLGKPAKARD